MFPRRSLFSSIRSHWRVSLGTKNNPLPFNSHDKYFWVFIWSISWWGGMKICCGNVVKQHQAHLNVTFSATTLHTYASLIQVLYSLLMARSGSKTSKTAKQLRRMVLDTDEEHIQAATQEILASGQYNRSGAAKKLQRSLDRSSSPLRSRCG